MQGFHAPDVKDARSLPGILLFAWLLRSGLVDAAIAEDDVRAATDGAAAGSGKAQGA